MKAALFTFLLTFFLVFSFSFVNAQSPISQQEKNNFEKIKKEASKIFEKTEECSLLQKKAVFAGEESGSYADNIFETAASSEEIFLGNGITNEIVPAKKEDSNNEKIIETILNSVKNILSI